MMRIEGIAPVPQRKWDLRKAAEALQDVSECKRFVNCVKLLNDAHSAIFDLKRARKQLEICERHSERHGDPNDPAPRRARNGDEQEIAAALFAAALLNYCRSTDGYNDVRSQHRVSNGWSADMASAHEQMHKLRSGAVAHYTEYEDTTGGIWAFDRLYLLQGYSGPFASMSLRFSYMHKVTKELQTLVEKALEALSIIEGKRSSDTIAALLRVKTSHPAHYAKIMEYEVLEDEFGKDTWGAGINYHVQGGREDPSL